MLRKFDLIAIKLSRYFGWTLKQISDLKISVILFLDHLREQMENKTNGF